MKYTEESVSMSYNYVHKLRVRLYFFIYEIYFMLSISLECLLIFDCDRGFESNSNSNSI